MKAQHIFITIFSFFLITSCNDEYLDRYPTTEPTPETFFTSAEALELYTYSFYRYLSKNEYQNDYESDNMANLSQPVTIKTGQYTMPVSLGSGGWSWTRLRDINFFIENCIAAEGIDQSAKNEQLAIAKIFRAWFYFDKVKQFGDVPWYSNTIDSDDSEQLYKPRDSRALVMDSVLADLNFAVEFGIDSDSKTRITRWTALALKSRICLYEGTWRKYHTETNLPDADKYLSEAVIAAQELITDGNYSIYNTGNIDDYYTFFNSEEASSAEVILALDLAEGNISDYNKNFTTTSVGTRGITRSLVNEYLMSDGTTFYSKYGNADDITWSVEHTDRDPRLTQTSMPLNFHRIDVEEIILPWFGQNHTGYQVIKRVGPPEYDNGDPRDVIIFRLAEVMLNYAEAKAELGTITQNDLDISINRLRERAHMPSMSITPDLDPYLDSKYSGTSDPLIIEIRRERRVELAIEGFRLDDLMRWKEGHLLRENTEGIYVHLNTYIDRNDDGEYDLYVYNENKPSDAGSHSKCDFFKLDAGMGLSNGVSGRILPYNKALPEFEDWEYVSPIPLEEILLNPQLEQNPEWEKIQP